MKIMLRPSYEEIFGNRPTNIENLMKNSNSEILYDFLALIIHEYDDKFNTESKQIEFLFSHILSGCEHKFKVDIKNRLLSLKQKNNSQVLIFNKHTCLYLLEYAISFSQKTSFIDNGETGLNIFKAFLIINSEITKKENKIYSSLKTGKDNLLEYHIVKLLPEVDITYFNFKRELSSQFIKYFLFVDYLEEYIELTPLSDSFIQEKGVSSFKDYFYKLFNLLKIGFYTNKFTISKDNDEEVIKFLDNLTLKSYDSIVKSDNDFLELRKFPIIKNSKNEYIILFYPFLFNKVFRSLYFDIKETLDKENLEIGKISNFKSFYNYSFSEKKLFYEAVNIVFKGKYKQIPGYKFEEYKIDNAPDYYIRNGNKLFLFENKAITISNKTKTSFDFELIKKELSKKLIENDEGKPKGIKQLKEYIISFLDGRYKSLDRKSKPSNCVIYPILVLHDISFYTPGINLFLNNYFEELIKDIDSKKEIKGITIIHIDDFLYYTNHLCKLDKLIDKYLNFQMKEKSSDNLLSFSEFIKFRNIIDDNKIDTDSNKIFEGYLEEFIEK